MKLDTGRPGLDPADRAEAVVRESVAREQRALKSMGALSRESSASVVAAALAQLPSADDVVARLRALVPGAAVQTTDAAGTGADSRVPVFVDDVAGFLDRRKALKRPTTSYPGSNPTTSAGVVQW